LNHKEDQYFKWQKFKPGDDLTFGVYTGLREYGVEMYAGRIRNDEGYYAVGFYLAFYGGLTHIDLKTGEYRLAETGIEILTCKSKKSEFIYIN
jgi:hypothetical protein